MCCFCLVFDRESEAAVQILLLELDFWDFSNSWKSMKGYISHGKRMKTIHKVFKLAVKHSN